jgi:hypothetical protein
VLASLALDNWYAVMAIPLHARPAHETGMWLRAKLRAGRDIIATRLRADENSLRQRSLDALPELMEAIRAAKAGNPDLDL